MTDNLILVCAYIDSGCEQADGDIQISWKPINFMIYSPLFQDMATEAADEWLSTFTMRHEEPYEAIFKHVVDHDGAGAVMGEYFERVEVKP